MHPAPQFLETKFFSFSNDKRVFDPYTIYFQGGTTFSIELGRCIGKTPGLCCREGTTKFRTWHKQGGASIITAAPQINAFW